MRAAIIGWFVNACIVGVAAAAASIPTLVIPPAPPAEQVAAARAEGDRMLSEAGARDLFDNETKSRPGLAIIVLRHKASGFVCLFDPGQAANNVVVYPNVHRGDAIGCNTQTRTGTRATNFTRNDDTDDQLIIGAADAIRLHVPDAEIAPAPSRVLIFATRFPNVSTPRSARFITANTFEEAVLGHVDGWLVESRFSAPRGMADNNALDLHWYITVAERLSRPRPDAVTGPPRPRPVPSGPPTAAQIAAARRSGDHVIVAGDATPLMSAQGADQMYVHISAVSLNGWIVTVQTRGAISQALVGDMVGELATLTAGKDLQGITTGLPVVKQQP